MTLRTELVASTNFMWELDVDKSGGCLMKYTTLHAIIPVISGFKGNLLKIASLGSSVSTE